MAFFLYNKRMDKYKLYFEDLMKLLDIQANLYLKWNDDTFTDYKGDKVEKYQLQQSAMATTKGNTIYVDLTKVNKPLEYFIIAHECRHVYQKKYIYEHDNKLARTWKKDLEKYQDSSVDGYENQSIEIDANAFALMIFEKLFKTYDWYVAPTINCDKDLLKQRLFELEIEYE